MVFSDIFYLVVVGPHPHDLPPRARYVFRLALGAKSQHFAASVRDSAQIESLIPNPESRIPNPYALFVTSLRRMYLFKHERLLMDRWLLTHAIELPRGHVRVLLVVAPCLALG